MNVVMMKGYDHFCEVECLIMKGSGSYSDDEGWSTCGGDEWMWWP